MNFDVFLSHNSKDKSAVEEIGKKLQETYNLKCWLDKWNLVPGEPWQEALEEALDDCQTVAVFVGPNTISPWENEEMRSALETRVHDKERRVVPVLLPGAPDNRDLKLPRFLTRLTWVDFRAGLDDEDALYRLYCGITGNAPGAPAGEIKADISKGLPPGSYIPFPRNALFTGREKDLKKLSALCELSGSKNYVISQAITGMGGIGKTQLAVEYAYRHQEDYPGGILWVNAAAASALGVTGEGSIAFFEEYEPEGDGQPVEGAWEKRFFEDSIPHGLSLLKLLTVKSSLGKLEEISKNVARFFICVWTHLGVMACISGESSHLEGVEREAISLPLTWSLPKKSGKPRRTAPAVGEKKPEAPPAPEKPAAAEKKEPAPAPEKEAPKPAPEAKKEPEATAGKPAAAEVKEEPKPEEKPAEPAKKESAEEKKEDKPAEGKEKSAE